METDNCYKYIVSLFVKCKNFLKKLWQLTFCNLHRLQRKWDFLIEEITPFKYNRNLLESIIWVQKNCQVYSINNLFLQNGLFLNSAIECDAEKACLTPFPSIWSVFPLCFLWPRYSKCMPSSAAHLGMALLSLLHLCAFISTCQISKCVP